MSILGLSHIQRHIGKHISEYVVWPHNAAGDKTPQTAGPATGFSQIQADDGQPSTQTTEVFVVYNTVAERSAGSLPAGRKFILKYSYIFDVFDRGQRSRTK